MGALEQFVKTAVAKLIPQDYPHLKEPAVMYATITGARKLEETYELDDLVIYNDESGGSYKGHIVAHWYEYTLRVVDRFGNLDAKFPELPSVRSKKQFQKGATVSIGLAYGDLSPTIIEEVIL